MTKWKCEICGCESDAMQDNCPNGCELEENVVEVVRRFHDSVKTFLHYHVQDDYDHSSLCLTKEFDIMKRCYWEVKEKILDV